MRVPLSWLAEYVDVPWAPEELAERLTLLGMEVKGIERRGAEWGSVVVGELLSVERHPRADRLSLTRVAVGSGEPLEIVCGATNIAPGQRVPVALPGAVLPGGRRIERTEKMGVVSNGMLCSGDELGLTADADGILILDTGAPPGAALTALYGDVVLDVDVKPNRGDLLSIVGLAREVAAAAGGDVVRMPTIEFIESEIPTSARLSVTVEDPGLCPRFVGRWVSGVTVAPSPDRVQMRLLAAGMRPISNVVDASNYVMLEFGKPIHTFDGGAVSEGRIVVRRARAGERLTTLDHEDRELDPETLLIADPDGPLAIAGVMGGSASEVGAGTRDVIVESAIFDPVSIRRTAFRYALRSEASLRFEKGQETRLARLGADRTAQLIADWAGGTPAHGAVDTAPEEPAPGRVAFRPARVDRLLGTSLGPAVQRELLLRVGIATEDPGEPVDVPIVAGDAPLSVTTVGDATVAVVPTWRRDIAIEADVAEEIARVFGYERIPPTLPDTTMPDHRPSPLACRDAIRAALAGAGLIEVVTHALVARADVERSAWRRPDVAVGDEGVAGGALITVTNPLSQDHAVLRQGLLNGLARVVDLNARQGRTESLLFEVGKGYGLQSGTPAEWWRLGIALGGPFEPPAWNRRARPADLDDAKGLIELLCRRLGFDRPSYAQLVDEPVLHPGRAATVEARAPDGTLALAGRVGELHPAAIDAWDVRADRLVVAELAVRGLSAGTIAAVRAATTPRHPGATRDLAVVVARTHSAASVGTTVAAAAGPLLVAAELFDIYEGPPLLPEERSLAYRLTFRAPDRTLTEPEVEAALAAASDAVRRDLGGHIRA